MATSLIHQEINFELILNATEQSYLMSFVDSNRLAGNGTVKLSVEEAVDLRARLQNPLEVPEQERHQECRSAIWSELHNCLETV